VATGIQNQQGLAVDSAGNVYWVNFALWEGFPNNLENSTPLPTYNANSVAVDAIGKVYYTDGQANIVGTPNNTLIPSGLLTPSGVAVDAGGNLYIADTGHKAIQKWTAARQQMTPLVTAGFSAPLGVALDPLRNLYITDNSSNTLTELPYAFVPAATMNETAGAGSDSIQILPATQPLIGLFAPSSDQSWLTLGSAANGVLSFSFAANTTGAARTAHITVLGVTIPVTQAALVASQVAFSTQPPSTSIAGVPFGAAVEVLDSTGLLVTTSTAPVTIGSTTVNAVGGIATFSNIVFDTVGTYTLTATSPGLASATSNPFSVVDGAGSQLVFTMEPPSAVAAGAAFSAVVEVQDAEGNLVTNSTAQVTIGSTSVNATGGIATFNNLVLKVAGTCSLTASSTGVSNVVSTVIQVQPAAASQLAFTTQPGSGTDWATAHAGTGGDDGRCGGVYEPGGEFGRQPPADRDLA